MQKRLEILLVNILVDGEPLFGISSLSKGRPRETNKRCAADCAFGREVTKEKAVT